MCLNRVRDLLTHLRVVVPVRRHDLLIRLRHQAARVLRTIHRVVHRVRTTADRRVAAAGHLRVHPAVVRRAVGQVRAHQVVAEEDKVFGKK